MIPSLKMTNIGFNMSLDLFFYAKTGKWKIKKYYKKTELYSIV